MDTILLFRRLSTRIKFLIFAVLISLFAAGPIGSAPVSAMTAWDNAEAVNFGALSNYNLNRVFAVSCVSADNCAVVGEFTNSAGGVEAFASFLANGVWGQATPAAFATNVRDTSTNAFGALNAVSCVSGGNCTAVGSFKNSSGGNEAFTMTSINGVWGQATPAVFADDVQNSSPVGILYSVDCASVGNCTASGEFKTSLGGIQAFTMTSINGVWGQATPAVFADDVQTLHNINQTYLRDVSCASAGNCTAVGRFRNVNGDAEAFTMTSTNGTWGQATPVVFPAGVQNSTPTAELRSVSCVSAGNCTAVGEFVNVAGATQALMLSSTNGVWGQPTTPTFASAVPYASLTEVICPSVGNCTAVGSFNFVREAFVVTSTNGLWNQAEPVLFSSSVSSMPFTDLNSVSCVSVGNCVAVGSFVSNSGYREAFTVSSVNSVWGSPLRVAFASGVQSSTPSEDLASVSCVSTGECVAGGYFKDSLNRNQGLVMKSANNTQSQTPNNPTTPSVASPTTTTVANAPTSSPTTTVAPRSLPATGSDITIGWLLTGMVCVLGGAVAVRLRHRLR